MTCGPETTVLDAAAQEGMLLPSLCRTGSCGACTALVVDGRFELGSHSVDALGRKPPPGAALLCRTFPRSACRITLPYDSSRIGDSLPPERSATITVLQRLTANTVRLVLALGPDALGACSAEFDPGQFFQLQVPGGEDRRAYSVANSSNWDGTLGVLHPAAAGGGVLDVSRGARRRRPVAERHRSPGRLLVA